jgi:capsular exopolysaccharide synthesis family protein
MGTPRRYSVTRVSSRVPGPVGPHPTSSPSFAGGFDTEIRTYASIVRRRSGWITWSVLLALGAGLAYTVLRAPVYRATSLVQIRGGGDSPSLDALFSGGDPSSESLRTRFGLMTSSTLAGRVIDELALDTVMDFAPEAGTERRQVIARFLDRLIVDPVESSNLLMVHFDASDRELAATVANHVVSTYGRMRVESHEEAARRVAEQADSVRSRLAESEGELRAFASDHQLPFLVEQDLTTEIGNRLGDLRTRLADVEGTRYESESMYDMVVRAGRNDLVESEALQTLELRVADLRSEHARITATFQDSYPAAAELSRQIEQVSSLIAEERNRLAQRVESDYRLAMQHESMLTDAIGAQEQLANELGPESGDYHVLRQAVLANRDLYARLVDRRRQAEIVAAIGPTDLEIVDPATPPLDPHSPVFGMNVGLALMLGLVMGVCLAFGREMLDDTVRTTEDFPISEDVPVLAMIPAVGSVNGFGSAFRLPRRSSASSMGPGREQGWYRIDKVHPTGRALADSFAALRTAVLFEKGDLLPRSLLVSSCRIGEGKTTVSVNLAMSLGQLGTRVLLIDADLRRPSVHRAFQIAPSPGLAHGLRGELGWEDAVQHSVARDLDVLPSGGATGRAGDLVASPRLPALLREAEEVYDYVIVDAPALFINAADARVLSRVVDGVVVVVRSRVTPRALVDRVPRVVPNVIGVVVNDLREDSLPDYFADYFAGYGEPTADVSDARDAERIRGGAT